MSYITKYGTYFGLVPTQLGRVLFVAPSASYTVDGRTFIASDDNDGLSPERALLTLARAYVLVNASAGEVIYLLEGTHAVSATLRLQKAGVTILGVRSPQYSEGDNAVWALRPKSVVSFETAGAPGFSIEANNIEIGFVTVIPAPTFSTVIFRGQTNTAPDGFYIHDFYLDFSKGQPSLDTQGIDFGYRADTAGLVGRSMSRLDQATAVATAYISNFCINAGGAYGPGILTATCDVVVNKGRFVNRVGVWASPFVVATGTGYVFIKSCEWTSHTQTGIGTAIDGTNSSVSLTGPVNPHKVAAHDCRFSGGPPTVAGGGAINNFPVGVISVIECYADSALSAVATSGVPNVGFSTPYQIVTSIA